MEIWDVFQKSQFDESLRILAAGCSQSGLFLRWYISKYHRSRLYISFYLSSMLLLSFCQWLIVHCFKALYFFLPFFYAFAFFLSMINSELLWNRFETIKIPDENPDVPLDFKILMEKNTKMKTFCSMFLRKAKRNLGFREKKSWLTPGENPDASRLWIFSVLRIRYVYPGSDCFPSRIPDQNFFPLDPGFSSKNWSILTQKNGF